MTSLQTLVFMFGIISIMGIWDGLVRRHIRLSYDALELFILLRGIAAILVGLLSAACLLFVIQVEIIGAQKPVAACPSFFCIVQETILVLFTTWQSIFVVLLCSFVFGYWLWGAFDLKGPYRRQMLAPGVWYKEKVVVEQVHQQLLTHRLSPMSDEYIIRAARTLIINLKTYAALQPPRQVTNGHLDPKALAEIYIQINPPSRRIAARISLQEQRIMVTTILRYYLELHGRAVAKWPWIKIILGY